MIPIGISMSGLVSKIPDIDLEEEVRKLVAQVPMGMVTTYGHVAKALGDVVASRFVGKVMSENEDIVRVPCRRVVNSDGRLGGYTGGGTPAKKRDLEVEGIEIEGDKIIDFEKRLFTDFKTTFPLRAFRKIQIHHARNLTLEDDFDKDVLIAGADVAYKDNRAFGALVIFDGKEHEIRDVFTIRMNASFPYIPTYLTFREFPIVAKLLEKVDRDEIMLIYDGNGIIHPLGFGIASHVGVLLDIPTIGVAKKLLCGSVVGNGKYRKVMLERRLMGYAVTGDSWRSPVYLSPGHRVSTNSSLKLLKRNWIHRIPEPVRIAHIEAEKRKRGGR